MPQDEENIAPIVIAGGKILLKAAAEHAARKYVVPQIKKIGKKVIKRITHRNDLNLRDLLSKIRSDVLEHLAQIKDPKVLGSMLGLTSEQIDKILDLIPFLRAKNSFIKKVKKQISRSIKDVKKKVIPIAIDKLKDSSKDFLKKKGLELIGKITSKVLREENGLGKSLKKIGKKVKKVGKKALDAGKKYLKEKVLPTAIGKLKDVGKKYLKEKVLPKAIGKLKDVGKKFLEKKGLGSILKFLEENRRIPHFHRILPHIIPHLPVIKALEEYGEENGFSLRKITKDATKIARKAVKYYPMVKPYLDEENGFSLKKITKQVRKAAPAVIKYRPLLKAVLPILEENIMPGGCIYRPIRRIPRLP